MTCGSVPLNMTSWTKKFPVSKFSLSKQTNNLQNLKASFDCEQVVRLKGLLIYLLRLEIIVISNNVTIKEVQSKSSYMMIYPL